MVATGADPTQSAGGWREQPLGRLLDRLLASDPAFSRLQQAGRAILSLLLAGALLVGLSLLHPLPIAAYGLAVVIALTGSMAVRDPTARRRLETRGYALLASVVAVFTASVAAPWPIATNLIFLVVIFVAVYVRRFGGRWFAVGTIAFMSFFMSDYLHPQPTDIGWMAVAAAFAFAATHVITDLVLRDDAERDFRRALISIDRRIDLILRDFLAACQAGPGPAAREPFARHVARLRDSVLMAEGYLPQGQAGSLAADGATSDLAVALFDLQLIVERTVGASYVALPPESLLRAALQRDEQAMRTGLAALGPAGDKVMAGRLLVHLHQTRTRLETALGPRPSPAFATPTMPLPAPARAPAAGGERTMLVPRSLQAPIQVTLACALAMGVGLMLSPVGWYWAVITAFIVFNNTKSRADTALHALQRSWGTFAGLVAGTAVATLVHGQPVVSGVGILVLFFLAFYFLQVSASLMIAFITVAVALLYGLMGTFSPDLLVQRLLETVVGAVAGTLVAFVVFPARASSGAAAALDKYLSALGELVAAARRCAHGDSGSQDLLARSRVLERAYTELTAAVRPLGGPWEAVIRFGQVRERLLLLSGCAHWGRMLARSLRPGAASVETMAGIDTYADEIDARIARARAMTNSFFERPEMGSAGPAQPRPPVTSTEQADPVFALSIMSALLDRAARGQP